MSDKDKPKLDAHEHEEEYFFTDEPDTMPFEPNSSIHPQSTPEKPASTEPKKGFSFPNFGKFMEKNPLLEKIKPLIEAVQQKFALRMALILGMVLLIIAVFYSCTSNPIAEKAKEKIPHLPVIQPQTNKSHEIIVSRVPTMTIGKKTAVSTNTSNNISTNTAEVEVPQDRLARIEKANADLQNQISAMSTQMLTLNSNVSTTAANLKQISDQLAQLATVVQNEAKVSAGIVEKIARQEKMMFGAGNMAMSQQPVQYFLQAIIPGRAWLISSEGETLTVSRGTPLGSYGRVSFIDAASGRVLTSSGQTILFKPDET